MLARLRRFPRPDDEVDTLEIFHVKACLINHGTIGLGIGEINRVNRRSARLETLTSKAA